MPRHKSRSELARDMAALLCNAERLLYLRTSQVSNITTEENDKTALGMHELFSRCNHSLAGAFYSHKRPSVSPRAYLEIDVLQARHTDVLVAIHPFRVTADKKTAVSLSSACLTVYATRDNEYKSGSRPSTRNILLYADRDLSYHEHIRYPV